jgi:YD repeat-containing protein
MARGRFLIGMAALCVLAAPTLVMAAETQTYTYDALGRLTQVKTSSGRTTDYTYDAANNRTQVVSTGGSSRVVVLPLLGGLVLPIP